MPDNKSIISLILMLMIQLILTKYCQFEPFVYICLLPAIVLCLPTYKASWRIMAVAFVAGLLVDGLADGPLGLNAMAAVVVAAIQKLTLRLCIGEEIVERGYGFSYHENGFFKIFLALIISSAVFFAVYVIADSAGIRSGCFNFMKWICSTGASVLFGLFAVNILSPYKPS